VGRFGDTTSSPKRRDLAPLLFFPQGRSRAYGYTAVTTHIEPVSREAEGYPAGWRVAARGPPYWPISTGVTALVG